jgi:hypothetical protein
LEPHQAAAAAERDVTCSMVHGGPLLAGIVLAERGGSEEAVRVVPFPEIRVGASGFAMAAHAGRYAIALGDPDRMKPFIEPFLQTIRRRPMHAGMPEIVELLVALGDWTTLASLQPQLRGYAAAIALVGPVADWAEASAPDTAPADAVRLAGGAVAAFDRMAAVFDAARARELLARLEPDEGTNLLVAAALAYRGLSAVPHLARVEAALNRVPSDPG